jgi:molybdopterin converting factor small subunit
MKVLFFGALAEITGNAEMELSGFEDTALLQQELLRRYPQLGERKFALALDKHLVRQTTVLTESSVVALLPPYSGG